MAVTAAPAPALENKGEVDPGQGRRGLLMVFPTLVLLAVVILYPLVRAVVQSFQSAVQHIDPKTGMLVQGGFAGVDNYKHWLLQQCGGSACPPGTLGSQFYSALGVTLFWTVVSVSIEIVLGLWFATIMNREFRGRGLVRAAILIPWAIPTAVSAKLWYVMFDYNGIVNKILGVVGISPLYWKSDTWPARFGIVIADVWKTAPFMALLILAGLQVISKDVYEAAEVDGASRWQTFTRITLPLIKVPLMVAILFRTLDVLRIYDLPAIMTGGASGTTSLSILVVDQIRQDFNSASALSTIVFLLIAFVAFIFIKFLGADVVQRPPKSPKAKKGRRGKPAADVEPEGAQA